MASERAAPSSTKRSNDICTARLIASAPIARAKARAAKSTEISRDSSRSRAWSGGRGTSVLAFGPGSGTTSAGRRRSAWASRRGSCDQPARRSTRSRCAGSESTRPSRSFAVRSPRINSARPAQPSASSGATASTATPLPILSVPRNASIPNSTRLTYGVDAPGRMDRTEIHGIFVLSFHHDDQRAASGKAQKTLTIIVRISKEGDFADLSTSEDLLVQ